MYTELIIFLSKDTKTNRHNNPSWKYYKEIKPELFEIQKLVNLVTVVYCEDQPEVARSFGVTTVPTTVLLIDDSEVSRVKGVMTIEKLRTWIMNLRMLYVTCR